MYDILMRLSLPLHEASQRQFNQALHFDGNIPEHAASLAAGKILMEWATICSTVVDGIRKEREQMLLIHAARGDGDGATK